MDAADRELFGQSLRQVTAGHTGEALDAELDALGWPDALASDPADAVALLFEQQGAANATSGALDLVLAGALGVEGAVVLPGLGRHDPPGLTSGGRVTVTGLGTTALGRADRVVVATADGALTVESSDLTRRPVEGIDPALGLVEVRGTGVDAGRASPADWEAAAAAGQRALAHELVGASRTMLQLARDHAVDRIQFGRPIASFQAVRHRLAESLVAVEAADGALAAAWEDGTPMAAALAKAIAGRTGRTVARHAQQVLAGIGFTTEHPLHDHVRRVIVLDRLLGDHHTLTRELGEQLLETRTIPDLLPL
jgi:hypothetical protein